MQTIVVSGIHTEVGKTIVSAILAAALNGDYWKPIQTGPERDSLIIASLTNALCHPEAYSFSSPTAAHQAAKEENCKIERDKIVLPKTQKRLIVEGSGGVMSPLDESTTQGEFFSEWSAFHVLVVKHYLGSINHTLLSIQALQPDLVVFNGPSNPYSEEFIFSKYPLNYLRVPYIPIHKREILCLAEHFRPLLKKIFKQSGTPSHKGKGLPYCL
jgi:dethiobiotin synthetase